MDVGPVPLGINRFVLQAPSPDISKIPNNDILGVTVVLITCSYRGQVFLQIGGTLCCSSRAHLAGYYVNNDYEGLTLPDEAEEGESMGENSEGGCGARGRRG